MRWTQRAQDWLSSRWTGAGAPADAPEAAPSGCEVGSALGGGCVPPEVDDDDDVRFFFFG